MALPVPESGGVGSSGWDDRRSSDGDSLSQELDADSARAFAAREAAAIAVANDDHEVGRLQALRGLHILDTADEQLFDDLTMLASQICDTPIALVCLVDEHQVRFRSRVGPDVSSASRDSSFWAHALSQADVLVVADTELDDRFVDNPLVTGEPHIRSYAGAPLITHDGFTLGALCVIDTIPRELTERQLAQLSALGRQVVSQLGLRRHAAELAEEVAARETLERSHAAELAQEVAAREALERSHAAELAQEVAARETLERSDAYVQQKMLARTEVELRDSRSLFESMASAVPAAFTVRRLDPPELLYASPGFVKVFGYDIWADATGNLGPLGDLRHIHADDQERIRDASDHLLDTGGRLEVDYRVVLPSAEVRWIHTSKAPLLDDDGSFARVASLSADVTERRLAEDDLTEANREAQRANSAKSELLSRTSHELRTPLNAVLGFAQLLELESLTKTQRDCVDHILRAGRHLLTMVDNVLDIATIDLDELDIVVEPIQVARIITDAVGLLRPAADAALIEVRYRTRNADTDHYVDADPRRLNQVLLHLLSNAVKYNHRNGHVDVHCTVIDSNLLHIAISDTGIGIRPEHFQRLFEPFDRVGAEVLNIEGTGIGLSIAQRLVHAMGAQLFVESTVGTGSTFTIAIPLVERLCVTPDMAVLEHQPTPTGTGWPLLASLTLVYIEDETNNIDLMQRIIALRPNWRMLPAQTGALGLEIIRREEPTLVFIDLHLPDTDGADVLTELQQSVETEQLPVIIVSADAGTAQIDHMRGIGATIYLTKPVIITDVLELLDHYDPQYGQR